jgi:hypothetical protein
MRSAYCCTTYVAANSMEHTLGLHTKCPVLLSHFNKILDFKGQVFLKSPQDKIVTKILGSALIHASRHTDGQTDGHDDANRYFYSPKIQFFPHRKHSALS